MNKLRIDGTQDFMGLEIPIVLGGFGKDKRCLSDKTIAQLHNQPAYEIRKSVGRNIGRFKENVDYIDLGHRSNEITTLEILQNLGYAKQSISQAEHIYFLSERGYSKLIKIMDTDLAWELHDKLIDEYFEMREVINSIEQKKSKLLLEIYDGGQSAIIASKELSQLEVSAATAPLISIIEEQKPKAEFHDTVRSTNNSISIGKFSGVVQKNPKLKKFGRNNMFKWLRNNGYLCTSEDLKNKPTQKALSGGYMEYEENVGETYYGNPVTTYQPLVTGKGQIYFIKKLLEEIED